MTTHPYPQSKSERIRFEGRDEARALVLDMAQQAKRQICIFGRDIDSILFDNPEFIDCVQNLALRSSQTEVKILVHDTLVNMQRDHRLIPLAQHLTSSIHVHKTAKQHRDSQQTLLLIDDFAYLNCPRATVYDGYACLYDRLEVRQLQQKFDKMWGQSSPDIGVRRLHL
ncbi:MAG: hypothetical protein GQ547_09130 [Methylophaga sp.]|nr:hypothetical protein [Methylophaga sp.]